HRLLSSVSLREGSVSSMMNREGGRWHGRGGCASQSACRRAARTCVSRDKVIEIGVFGGRALGLHLREESPYVRRCRSFARTPLPQKPHKHRRKTAVVVGGSTAVGAGLGAIFGGKK